MTRDTRDHLLLLVELVTLVSMPALQKGRAHGQGNTSGRITKFRPRCLLARKRSRLYNWHACLNLNFEFWYACMRKYEDPYQVLRLCIQENLASPVDLQVGQCTMFKPLDLTI